MKYLVWTIYAVVVLGLFGGLLYLSEKKDGVRNEAWDTCSKVAEQEKLSIEQRNSFMVDCMR